MATTFVDYTGDGNATKSFSFPSIKEADIKVDVDGVIKTSGSHYNITSYTTTGGGNVVFTSGNIPASPASIRIFRDTDVDSAKATFTAGSSVKAGDLNLNQKQLLYAAQEEQNQTVLTSKIKDAAVTSAKIKDGTIVNANINASAAIDGTKISPAFGSQNITTSGTVDGRDVSVDGAKLDGIEAGATADQTAAEIRTLVESASDSNVFTDADHSKLNAIEASATADQTASEIKSLLQSDKLTVNEIADNAITTSKIQDAELSTLASMQSGTASVLADSTALTSTTAELNQLSGITLETSVTTNSNQRIPTSKAVNDQILAVTNALGGFVAIANETSFPTANPDPSNGAGTVVSISQLASGLAVNSSGVATISNGAGSGNTVTITGFPSSLHSQTLSASSGLQVQTTTTLHTYTFHKQLASAADIQAISATVNSFSNRYRVSASAPTSSLDGGDLWYDTTNSKLMVYSSANSAWEESSAIGNFFISTISSSSNTGGGSATANGTAYRFTISDAPISAQQLIVSVDGVIQKPNAGSSQPSEGFVLVGNDIIFGSAPANGASMFVTVIGSTVGIGTPSNNTVTSAILQNASVIEAKLANDAVTSAKIAQDAVTGTHIAAGVVGSTELMNNAVTSAKIADGTIVNADVNASAAIDGSKITPNFGSQAITGGHSTFGNITATGLGISNTNASINFTDTNGNPDYSVIVDGGVFDLNSTTPNANIIKINTDGHIDVGSNVDFASGIDVTGNITVSGTVDGVDIAALNTTVGNITTDLVTDTTPQLGGLLDGNGNTANFTANNTGLGLPSGTAAQEPTASNYEGYIRYNTDDNLVYYSDGTSWLKIAPTKAVLNSVTGTLFDGAASTLTLAGTGFLSANLVVNFVQSSDSINANVTVTPSSDTAATVAVPSSVYSNVTAGNVVTMKVTNSDGQSSGNVTITATSLPTGGTITTYTDSGNTYRVHTFTTSGNFVNTISGLTATYLIVAGGGGAACDADVGGGGGAGGLLTGTTSPSINTHQVVVGNGGLGANTSNGAQYNHWRRGEPGGNSSFAGHTAIGGGYGNTRINNGAGGNGGSGGGGGDNGNQPGGSGTAGQGHDGGGNEAMNSNNGNDQGGGGGAGSAGNGRHPGSGYTSTITGTSKVYARGGSGYHHPSSLIVHNTDNYGWGGRGSTGIGTADAYGAKGVVIIRYQI